MGPDGDRLYGQCDTWVTQKPALQITRIKHSLIASLTRWFLHSEKLQLFLMQEKF